VTTTVFDEFEVLDGTDTNHAVPEVRPSVKRKVACIISKPSFPQQLRGDPGAKQTKVTKVNKSFTI
jgi:hypothetical protein